MSAAIGSFRLEILDSETGAILKHTIIGNRTYVSAIEGKEFAVRVTVHDPTKYIDTINGDNILSCDFYFNGLQGKSVALASRTSPAVVSLVIDSFYISMARKSLVFDVPAVIPFFDVDDAKQNIETNKDSITGTISVRIRSSRSTGERYAVEMSPEITASKVHDTKKFFQRPNIGIATGRVLGKISEDDTEHECVRGVLVKELKVWCQSDVIVSLLERLERDKEDVQQPADFKRPCKVEKRIFEGTPQLVDLTDNSSSHSSKKQTRESKRSSSSSSISSSSNTFPIDLTSETSITPNVKKEPTRLLKEAIHFDLT
jgi:hypothetical protein